MAEFNKKPFERGTVALPARRILIAPTASSSSASPSPVPQRPVHRLGRGDRGMENVDKIAVGEPPANPTKMTKVRLQSDM